MSENTTSWIDGDVKQAADMLANRAVFARSLRTEKQAFLDKITGAISEHPGLAMTLGGAGAGAAVGGLSGASKPKDRRSTLSSALTGALAGAGVGGGAYASGQLLKSLGAGGGGGGSSFIHNGKKFNLSPKALTNSPELMQEIDKLQETSLPTKLVGGSMDFMKAYASRHPAITALMLGDIGVHGLGGLAQIANPKTSINPQHLLQGAKKIVGTKDALKGHSKGVQKLITALNSGRFGNDELQKALVHIRSGAKETQLGRGKIPADVLKRIAGEGSNTFRRGGVRSALDIMESLGVPTDSLTGTGWERYGRGLKKVRPAGGNTAKLLRLFEGGRSSAGAGLSRGAKWGIRGGMYAGVPLAMEYARIASGESENKARLDELIRRISAPAKGE